MKVFMKKAELHNIQFKKSQIQWNPIIIAYKGKVSGYKASQLQSSEHNYIQQIHYMFRLCNPNSSYNGVPP